MDKNEKKTHNIHTQTHSHTTHSIKHQRKEEKKKFRRLVCTHAHNQGTEKKKKLQVEQKDT